MPIYRVVIGLLVLIVIATAGCNEEGNGQDENGSIADGDADVELETFSADDYSKSWILIEPPAGDGKQTDGLSNSREGFVALVREPGGKYDIEGPPTTLVSKNGLDWTEYSINIDGFYRGIAYGNGLLVAVGRGSNSLIGSIIVSDDGITWKEIDLTIPDLINVIFCGDRFLAIGNNGGLLSSEDGEKWDDASDSRYVTLNSATCSKDTFVAVGSVKILNSKDAVVWREWILECGDPSSCPAATSPGWQPGDTVALSLESVFFGNDTFIAGQIEWQDVPRVFTSKDGVDWEVIENVGAPELFTHGVFLRITDDETIETSKDGIAWEERTSMTMDNPNKLSCEDHQCIVVDSPLHTGLLLIP